MPANLLPLIAVLLAGLGVAVQTPTNAALARTAGSVWLAALVSFTVGTSALVLVWTLWDRTPLTALRGTPAWMWLGGLYGAGFVAALAYAAPRLGLAVALTLAIGSQITAAVAIDHWGLLGLDRQPVTATRLVGIALVVGGVLLVRR